MRHPRLGPKSLAVPLLVEEVEEAAGEHSEQQAPVFSEGRQTWLYDVICRWGRRRREVEIGADVAQADRSS